MIHKNRRAYDTTGLVTESSKILLARAYHAKLNKRIQAQKVTTKGAK